MTIFHRLQMLVAASALILGTAACNSDSNPDSGGDDPSPTASDKEDPSPTTSPSTPNDDSPPAETEADVDPCALLTIPEMESAVGPGLQQGGLGEEVPGNCTFSINGDVLLGAVRITVGSERMCDSIKMAIDAPEQTDGITVDVGDGGLAAPQGGLVTFLVGDGCITISASESDVGLDPDKMVALAKAAAGRVS